MKKLGITLIAFLLAQFIPQGALAFIMLIAVLLFLLNLIWNFNTDKKLETILLFGTIGVMLYDISVPEIIFLLALSIGLISYTQNV